MRLGLARARVASVALALLALSCGKFQQARECGTFVKTVNGWLAGPALKGTADARVSSDPKAIAAEARATAQHYADLSSSLADLHIQSEELAPRVKRYQDIANDAARTLREVADSLEQGDLEKARQKRVDFDTVAQLEAPLVKEINGVCR